MNLKVIAIVVVLVILLIVFGSTFSGCVGKNDFATYQIKQSIDGTVTVIDAPGYYNKAFATVYTYPRSIQAFYSASSQEGGSGDESIRVHFNDGGTAAVSVMVQFQLPTDSDKQKHLHQTFGSIETVKQAVRAHLINCVKNTGPMMSATENQAARKGEFNQVVEEQLRKGIYAMRRVEVELKDHSAAPTTQVGVEAANTPVKVMATEIVVDDKTGQPVIVEKSPLDEYGITIQQFSITDINYDDLTKQQFAAKQASYLAAEKSKAMREAEVQQTLMVVQKGLREKAEVEASENVKKQQAVIEAQAKAEVALQEKKQAETVAEQALSVAKLTKDAAEMKANQDAQVLMIAAEQSLKTAQLKAEQSVQEAKSITTLAEAEQKKIAMAGALSEKDKLSMELQSKTQIGTAEALSHIAVPSTVITGGSDKGNVTESLLNISLLRSLGIIKEASLPQPFRVTESAIPARN